MGGVTKAMADLPPSPRKAAGKRGALSPRPHLQSPGVAKSLLGKTESPCRQSPAWWGSSQKQTERSPAPTSPRQPLASKCQSPRAQSPSPPWGTDTDLVSGYKPGASPIRNHMSSEEAK